MKRKKNFGRNSCLVTIFVLQQTKPVISYVLCIQSKQISFASSATLIELNQYVLANSDAHT